MIYIKRLKETDRARVEELINVFQFDVCKINTHFLKNENNYLLAAYLNEKITGFLYGYALERIERIEPMMFLYSIEVIPESRKQGVATALVNKFIEHCKQRNCMKMFLISNKSNIAAMKLYQSTGGYQKSDDDIVFTYLEKI